jgi:hypothetical protein
VLTLVAPHYTLENTVLEQRKNQRFDLRLPFELLSGKAHEKAKTETRNVSSCGVMFLSEQPLEVGESVEYMITLPKAPGTRVDVRLHCMGKVVRHAQESTFAATLERYEFIRGKA